MLDTKNYKIPKIYSYLILSILIVSLLWLLIRLNNSIPYETLGYLGIYISSLISASSIFIPIPGIGAAVDKGRGFSQNPNLEMVFKSVPFRNFNFPYEFAPKNEKEKDEVQRILSMFKFHMLPEKFSEGY